MTTVSTIVLLIVLVVTTGLIIQAVRERLRRRDAALNRETWEIYRAARRVHEQAVAAFDDLLQEARRETTRTSRDREQR